MAPALKTLTFSLPTTHVLASPDVPTLKFTPLHCHSSCLTPLQQTKTTTITKINALTEEHKQQLTNTTQSAERPKTQQEEKELENALAPFLAACLPPVEPPKN